MVEDRRDYKELIEKISCLEGKVLKGIENLESQNINFRQDIKDLYARTETRKAPCQGGEGKCKVETYLTSPEALKAGKVEAAENAVNKHQVITMWAAFGALVVAMAAFVISILRKNAGVN